MITRQDIITWYTLDEKMPPEDTVVIVTLSGHTEISAAVDHMLDTAVWHDGEWFADAKSALVDYTIHAWCDLEPYKGGKA